TIRILATASTVIHEIGKHEHASIQRVKRRCSGRATSQLVVNRHLAQPIILGLVVPKIIVDDKVKHGGPVNSSTNTGSGTQLEIQKSNCVTDIHQWPNNLIATRNNRGVLRLQKANRVSKTRGRLLRDTLTIGSRWRCPILRRNSDDHVRRRSGSRAVNASQVVKEEL